VTNAIGLFTFGFGLAARFGYLKRMFITKGIPGIYPRSTVYALMPLGIFFIAFFPLFLWAGENALDRAPSAIVFFGLAILVVVSLVWQPRWLKPAWLRWLEDNYGHVRVGMFEEARQMGARNWEAQVATQADLERWADSVARKHGWQRLR
jgi:hypothetical protein